MRNLSLFPDEKKPQLLHKETRGKRKEARLLVKGRPIHLILKSRFILFTHERWIRDKIEDYAKRFGIKIFKQAICGDHMHFAIQIPNRDYYKKFIRALTGVIARKMGKGIWSLLPLTRVANWGRDFKNLLAYIVKNDEEARILRKYEPRKRKGPMLAPAQLGPACEPNPGVRPPDGARSLGQSRYFFARAAVRVGLYRSANSTNAAIPPLPPASRPLPKARSLNRSRYLAARASARACPSCHLRSLPNPDSRPRPTQRSSTPP